MSDINAIVTELRHLVATLKQNTPPKAPETDWSGFAFQWRSHPSGSYLETIHELSQISLHDLKNIDRQKSEIRRNTEQFVNGLPANNVLLTGSRGTGKSSLVKALLNEFKAQGLRVIEVDRHLLNELPDIMRLLINRPERFIIYCDDLSFSEDDSSYRALKTTLDGSLHAGISNVVVYATSNRRHLMPQLMQDNQPTGFDERGEINPAEAIEDKVSLSDRFGLWLSFYANTQSDYLHVVSYWLEKLGYSLSDETKMAALRFAQLRGHRSGRAAFQFAKDWAGRKDLEKQSKT